MKEAIVGKKQASIARTALTTSRVKLDKLKPLSGDEKKRTISGDKTEKAIKVEKAAS